MKLYVTGHDARGKAIFSHAGTPPREIRRGSYDLWTTRGPIVVPDDADPAAPSSVATFPSPGETAFRIYSVPPQQDRPQEVASPTEGFEAEDPEMHTSDTLDYVIILGGQADLELDDGRKERVVTGDCIVQRGTRHAWRVVGDEPLILCAILLGAQRA
jgi:quercetin dioxygenase-like cupin family protein